MPTITFYMEQRMYFPRIIALLMAVFLFSAHGCMFSNRIMKDNTQPRYIIFMVPDGMGLADVTAARIYRNGPQGKPLYLERLPYIGYQKTYSRNSMITDSAAAASAWASGEKFNNDALSCLDQNTDGICDGTRKNHLTILESAQKMGLDAGLVVTSEITHATPAAWAVHVHHRECGSEIFEQYLARDIKVLLGGGIETNRDHCLLPHTDDSYNKRLLKRAEQYGYRLVYSRDELLEAPAMEKLIGLFHFEGLTPVYLRERHSIEPTLAQMTQVALNHLNRNPQGFFLIVEGSQIDWANHERDFPYQIHETLAFDESVKGVWDWIQSSRERKQNTLLIVAADHECGGVIIEGPKNRLSQSGPADAFITNEQEKPNTSREGQPLKGSDLEITFSSNADNPEDDAEHTGVDTLIWSNSPRCARALDNTDLYHIMMDFLYKTK